MRTPVMGTALLLAMAGPLSGAGWREGEKRTVAYVAMGLESFAEWNLATGDGDPFGETEPGPAFPRPLRWTKDPPASRFFRDGDELWLVTAILVRLEVLEPVTTSWAIFNATRNRLVLHGSRGDHGRLGLLWEHHLAHSPRLVETRTRLLQVRSRELEGVEWTAALVRQRGAEELIGLAVTSRPGQKGSTSLKGARAEGSLEVEAHVGSDDRFLDLRMDYEVRLTDGSTTRDVQVDAGLSIWSDVPTVLEVGSEDDEEHTLVVEVRSAVHFMDGTPRRGWREFEDPRDEPSVDGKAASFAEAGRDLGDGFFLRAWHVPPTFLEDIRATPEADAADPDPFGDAGGGRGAPKPPEFPVVEGRDAALGPLADDLLYDVGDAIREGGVEIPENGWVYYASRTSVIVAKLDPANLDLVHHLLEGG